MGGDTVRTTVVCSAQLVFGDVFGCSDEGLNEQWVNTEEYIVKGLGGYVPRKLVRASLRLG